MADDFRSGKNGKATVNGTELAITRWAVDPTTEIARFRNSRTGGFDQKDGQFQNATFSIGIDYDFDQSPFGAPLNITAGTQLTDVRLYLDTTTGPHWYFPSAIVTGIPQSLDVGGRIETTINGENDGTFSPPTT